MQPSQGRKAGGKMVRGWWRKLVELRPIPVIDLVTLVVAVLGFWFLWYELDWVKRIAKSQNNIMLTQGFFHDEKDRGIMDAIYDDKPILKKSGGNYTDGDLDTYLGDLDMVEEVFDEGLLSEKELCGSFADVIDQTASNQEVKDYLKENSDYFSGLPHLFHIVKTGKDENCKPVKRGTDHGG
jgi:hypothetical protein